MIVDVLSAEGTEQYEEYVRRQRGALFYHGSKYKDFLKDLLRCEEEYLLVWDGGTIRGVMPLLYLERAGGRLYNSLPYYGSNGGVLADNEEVLQRLIGAYNAIAHAPKTLGATVIANPFVSERIPGVTYDYLDYRIAQHSRLEPDDDGLAGVMARVKASARRNVKKAIREGIEVVIDPDALERAREIHQANITAMGGIPKSDRFFALLPRHFSPGRDFDLYVAKRDDVVIAGLLLFYFNATVEYFMPFVDRAYRALEPMALVLAVAMSEAAHRGFNRWNWGGTWPSQPGVYAFKRKWGAEESRYWYYVKLNERSVLQWPVARMLETFEHFYVVPFPEVQRMGVGDE